MRKVMNRRKHSLGSPVEAPLSAKRSKTLLKNVVNIVENNTTSESPKLNIKDPNKSEPSEDVMSQSSDVARKMIQTIKKVLENNFKDPVERLQLDFVPKCLYNLKECAVKHSKRAEAPTIACFDNIYFARQLILEERYFQFIEYVKGMVGRNEFPGPSLLLSILELILTLDEKDVSSEVYPLDQILGDLYSLFYQILLTFPPCNLRSSYLEAFTKTLETEAIGNTSGGILTILLDLLFDTIYSQNTPENTKRNCDFDDDKRNNYYLWENEQKGRSNFESFDRSMKFERIFLVLDLLLKVLETDLATWMIKYSNKMYTYMNREDRSPMISMLIYQKFDNIMIMSSRIKKIIKIFVDMVGLNYPEKDVAVFSRLLNLLAFVMNLYEYPDETFVYPAYKNITLDFVKEIKNAIENSFHYSLVLYLKVIESLKSPLTKMLLCNLVYQKVENYSGKLSLEQIFQKIQQKSFLNCTDVHMRKPEVKSLEKYPLLQKSPGKPSKFQIFTDEYLKFLLIFAKSIDGYYRISDYSRELKKDKSQSLSYIDSAASISSQPSIPDFYNFEDDNLEALEKGVNLQEKIQISTRGNNFRKLIHIKVNKDEFMFYRSEVKWFLLLKQVVIDCCGKYEANFSQWLQFIQEVE